ncbi:MAG: T9SS type A sorting domain-containing protein, partial [Candidatus Marsarchaeota archaeon]|nr:T9SS type A sorting domain-containing protein [Candidatus Marsarchaeota archaeon]
ERLVSAFCSLYPDAVLNTARGQVGGPFIMVEAGAWRTYPFKFDGEPVDEFYIQPVLGKMYYKPFSEPFGPHLEVPMSAAYTPFDSSYSVMQMYYPAEGIDVGHDGNPKEFLKSVQGSFFWLGVKYGQSGQQARIRINGEDATNILINTETADIYYQRVESEFYKELKVQELDAPASISAANLKIKVGHPYDANTFQKEVEGQFIEIKSPQEDAFTLSENLHRAGRILFLPGKKLMYFLISGGEFYVEAPFSGYTPSIFRQSYGVSSDYAASQRIDVGYDDDLNHLRKSVSGNYFQVRVTEDGPAKSAKIRIEGKDADTLYIGEGPDASVYYKPKHAQYFKEAASPLDIQFVGYNLRRDFGFVLSDAATAVKGPAQQVKSSFIESISPNPAGREKTKIGFSLPENSPVWMRLYDARGQEVSRLADGQPMASGKHVMELDASALAAGLYFVQLSDGKHQHSVPLIVK